jgi:Bacterial Ig-like domain/Putative Ig domain/Cadherin domain
MNNEQITGFSTNSFFSPSQELSLNLNPSYLEPFGSLLKQPLVNPLAASQWPLAATNSLQLEISFLAGAKSQNAEFLTNVNNNSTKNFLVNPAAETWKLDSIERDEPPIDAIYLDRKKDSTPFLMRGQMLAVANTQMAAAASAPDQLAPVIIAGLVSDTGMSSTDRLTNNAAITGTVADSSTITLFQASLDGGAFVNILPQLSKGKFSITAAQLASIKGSAVQDGAHSLQLKAQDQYGNISGIYTLSFTLDTTVTAPGNLTLNGASDSGSSNGDRITNITRPIINGIGEAGGVVSLFDGTLLVGQGTVGTDGKWQVTTSILCEGQHQLTAKIVDVAGNTSAACTALMIKVDTTVPQIQLSPLSNIQNGTKLVGKVSDVGSGVAALSYRWDNQSPIAVTFNSLGDFNQGFDLTGIDSGQHTLTLVGTDVVGNSITQTLTVQVQKPVVITAQLFQDTAAGGTTNSDKITFNPQIQGTIAGAVTKLVAGFNGALVANYVDIKPQLLTNGTFSLDRTTLNRVFGGVLPDGTHTLRLVATSGVSSTCTGVTATYDFTFTLDTVIPLPTLNLAVGSDTGVVGDYRTSAAVVNLTGKTEANAVVRLSGYSNSVTADAQGNFTFTNVALIPQANAFTVTATDLAGNTKNYTQTIYRISSPPTAVNLSTPQVLENSLNGLVVGELSTVDPDGVDNYLYTLVDNAGGRFQLDVNKIKVANGSLLDFEANTVHQIQVRSTDSDGNSYLQTIAIAVGNVNEAPISLSITKTILEENVLAGTVVGNLASTDPDLGDSSTYSLVAGAGDTDNSAFRIVDRQLVINSSPNFEAKNSYSVRLRVTDGGGLTFDRTVTIQVTDVNEAPGQITLSNSAIAENSVNNAAIATLTTADPDVADTATYALINNAGGRFVIVGNELRVANGSLLDFETNTAHQISISSTDKGGLTVTQQFTIQVTNVNEKPTDLLLSNNLVVENTAAGSVIGSFSTLDPDAGDTHSYSLVNGTGSSDNVAFSIINNQLKFQVSPDFETKSSYNLRVKTTDAGGLSVEKELIVNILNVNEAPMQLILDANQVAENSAIGTLIGRLTAADPDAGEAFSYSFVVGSGSQDNGKFTLAGNGLYLNAVPDFETQSQYSLRLRVTDRAGLTFDQVLTIGVNDVNEAPTALNLSNTVIAENVLAGTVVGDLSSIDPDLGDSGTYSLVAGAVDNSAFRIVNRQLVINQSPDFEAKNAYSVRLRVSDRGGLTFDRLVTIQVTDVNEAPSQIALSNTAIAEDSANNAAIATLTTADPDGNETATYQLVNNANGRFVIVGNELRVANGSLLDFEANTAHQITISSTDKGGLTVTQQFTIQVTNVNEAPIQLILDVNQVAENSAIGTLFGHLTATDPDAGETFSYALVAGTGGQDNAQFTITGNGLQLNTVPDFETQNQYSIRLRVTDREGLTFDQVFSIGVNNVNEAPTALNITKTIIDENVLAGTVVGDLSSTDPDFGDSSTYSLVAGVVDNSAFSIIDRQLVINQSPDFEAKDSYSVRLRVTDGGGLTFDRLVTIQVADVNEAPSQITLSNTAIAENSANNAAIATLTSLDPDFGDTATYALTDNAGGRFAIVGNELRVANGSLLDFETNTAHQITISSTDRGGLTVTQQFAIQVTNVNETPTNLFLSNNLVAENTAIGSVVGSFSTLDVDAGDTHSYSLVNGTGDSDNAAFTITNNQLKFQVSPDFETKSIYSLRVKATDAGGLSVEKLLTVNITNVNEAPTQLILDANQIAENSAIGTLIGRLTSIDPDSGDTHSYSLAAGFGDNGQFEVVNNELRLNFVPDFESRSVYQLRVRTTDLVGAFWEQELTVRILDTLENQAPTAISLSNSLIAEGSANNTLIAQLQTTDLDATDTHSYVLLNDAGGRFKLVGNELRVANGSLLDFEAATSHQIRLRTTDSGNPSLAYERDITIGVTNINETPIFTSTPLRSASTGGLYQYTITTTDPDGNDSRVIASDRPLPSWLQLVDNGNGTATLSGTPTLNDIGFVKLHLVVTDAAGANSIQEFDLGVSTTLVESTSFNKRLDIPLTVGATGGTLSFKLAEVNFDRTDTRGINDALEIALVDANGQSLVLPFQNGRDAFFNWTEGENILTGESARYDAATGMVTLDLSDVAAGAAHLIFRLVNDDSDTTTSVRFTDLVLSGTGVAIDGAAPAPDTARPPVAPVPPAFFNTATDVSPSIGTDYHRTSFNPNTKELYANVALVNQGTYGLNGSMVVVIKNISDPTVELRNADGYTPDGLAYYTFTSTDGNLDPTEVSAERTLVFKNPNGVQFTYEVMVLADLNNAPVISSQPEIVVLRGQTYQYQMAATDRNGDPLTYRLLSGPTGMAINANTGLVSWTTNTAEVGNYQIAVEVSDGRGGISQQNYNLGVITPPPNRPPTFLSNPIVGANIGALYNYQVRAEDLDGDQLTYSLVSAPAGMTINAEGKVSWTPGIDNLGSTLVKVKVEDGRGGSALQEYNILTQAALGNQAPVFTSDPVKLFNLAATINAAQGNVNHQIIDLELPEGAVATKNISITLPSDGTSGADIVFVVDESGSMGDARAWITNMVIDLNSALNAAGITSNRYAFVGYGPGVIAANFNAEEPITVYTIEGKAGENLYFDLEPDQLTGFSWTLINAYGQTVKTSTTDFEVTFLNDGKYSLLIQNPATAPAYQYKIISSRDTIKSLELGAVTTGRIQLAGESDKYTFSGNVGDRIYFDGHESVSGVGNNALIASLATDSNVSIFQNVLLSGNSSSFILSRAGTYTLTISGQTDGVGDYGFRLWREGDTLELSTNGTPVNLTLEPQKSVVYSFNGVAGQRLTFDSLSNVPGTWKLIGPSNQQLASAGLNADFSLTLSANGSYWLVLDSSVTASTGYNFKVQSSQELAIVNSGFGVLHGEFLNPGQQQIHTFEARGGTLIYLDNQDLTTDSISIQIKDSAGTLISTISGTTDSGVISLSRSGTYTLTVKNSSTIAVGDYAFQVLDLSNGEIIDRNTTIAGALPIKTATKLYTLYGCKLK